VKAAVALGIPARVVAPKGWVFRGADGVDVVGEAAFKARFGVAVPTAEDGGNSAGVG
jgi:hypothetical protein